MEVRNLVAELDWLDKPQCKGALNGRIEGSYRIRPDSTQML